MRESLWKVAVWLLLASKGGRTRVRILKSLMKKPGNIYEISRRLGLNYRTVKYHLDLMLDHGLVEKVGNGYGSIYIVSDKLEKDWRRIESMLEDEK